MRHSIRKLALATTAILGTIGGLTSAAEASTITKAPDLGAYWQPLSSNGTYVYANSFVANESGSVSNLGTWLLGGGSEYQLEILSDLGGSGPDGANVLAQTAVQQGIYDALTYVSFATLSSANLIAGQTYWFAASTVGLGGQGEYQVGGHSQNSGGITDNGTFWYSNDPAGLSFDGRGLTPEMAFTVDINGQSAAPEPASWAMMTIAFGTMGVAMRRRRKVTVAFA